VIGWRWRRWSRERNGTPARRWRMPREASQLADLRARAITLGLPPDRVETLFRAQIDAGKQIQRTQLARWAAAGAPPFAGAPDLRADIRPGSTL
jgi:hypothetical protein